jgi:hypothetical protein
MTNTKRIRLYDQWYAFDGPAGRVGVRILGNRVWHIYFRPTGWTSSQACPPDQHTSTYTAAKRIALAWHQERTVTETDRPAPSKTQRRQ